MKVFTIGQCAKFCKVSPRTASKWFDSGRLRGYRIPGSQDRRVPQEYLFKFMTEHGLPIPDELNLMELDRIAVHSLNIVASKVAQYYEEARKYAVAYVEAEARRLLLESPDVDEFIMGMGAWCFSLKDGGYVESADPRLERLDKFIDEWDEYLKMTGIPMRFTASGEKVVDW